MTDDQQKDIFLAILSMKAYNQGLDSAPGIPVPSEELLIKNVSSSIGIATANAPSDLTPNIDDSFFATIYSVASVSGFTTGQVVIAFRGTDNYSDITPDPWTGWTLGLGLPNTSQGVDALNFYNQVLDEIDATGDASEDSFIGNSNWHRSRFRTLRPPPRSRRGQLLLGVDSGHQTRTPKSPISIIKLQL